MDQAKYSSEWILAQTVLSKTRMAYISKHHPTQGNYPTAPHE